MPYWGTASQNAGHRDSIPTHEIAVRSLTHIAARPGDSAHACMRCDTMSEATAKRKAMGMEQLTIIGTEDDKLVLATEAGERFTLAIDDTLHRELKKQRKHEEAPDRPRASPRDIQTHIRAGLSAQEVADLLGTSLEDVQRYEGPVVAEREHVVTQALAVPVLIGSEVEPDGTLSFGEAIRAKLAELEATGERWSSWKDETGWVVKLEFTASDVEHDARWGFDPRRSTLSPQNSAATQLSRQGSLPEGLIPRLRALDNAAGWKDDSRFDSGAFGPRRLPDPEPEAEAEEIEAPTELKPAARTAADAAVNRAPESAPVGGTDTADLLEALRRRRGQREPLPNVAQEPASEPEPRAHLAPVALFETEDEVAAPEVGGDFDDSEIVAEKEAAERAETSRRRGSRTSMPSWDEIVFGAKTDD